jgi:hypothetical protein
VLTYTISITDGFGCLTTDEVVVVVMPLPAFNLGNDTIICSGTSITLDPGNYANYLWQDASTAQTYNVSNAGLYWVNVIDQYGCTNTDSIDIDVDLPYVSLGNDTSYCFGYTHVLDPGSFDAYLWQDGKTNPTYNVTNTGIYNVHICFFRKINAIKTFIIKTSSNGRCFTKI